ncbi:hypothetical protein MW887_007186 [Aspergillus wentii]|nr:hypothetical protein MW887_007186 [Aspergillus wentii]
MDFITVPSIQFGLPPRELFSFPPSQRKTPIPAYPDSSTRSLLRPFTINPHIFHASLDLKSTLTFIAIYVTAVLSLNQLNASRRYKPWAFSKTSTFRALVILHNALLALFSAWTFFTTCQALKGCWPAGEPNYYAHVAEMLCETDSSALRTSAKSLWEEGSGYIGWVFYISKFYEVLDTMIILARGKKSSTLQTYHHAGVIICGWATMKYKSPASLVGIVLNSAVHTLMYSYFTIHSLGVSVPMSIKRSLTTIQIAQFLTGFVWGYSYLFVKYHVPLDITAQPVDHSNSWESGSYSRMEYNPPSTRGSDSVTRVVATAATPCLSDSGEALTVVLTTVYVLPLLLLFVRFFIESYTKGGIKAKD